MTLSRGRLLRLLLVTAGLAALVWTICSLDPGRVWHLAMTSDPFWLGLSALPIVLRFLVWGIKWKQMLERHAPVAFAPATRIIAASSFVNLTTPTAKLAGGLVRAVLLNRRYGWRLSVAYGWALADQVTNLLGHTLLFALGTLAFSFHPAAGSLRPVFALVGCGALIGLVLGVWGSGPMWIRIQRPSLSERVARFVPDRFLKKGGVTPDLLQRIFGPLLHDGASWKAFSHDVLLAALAFATLPIAHAMVLRSLGVDAPLVMITVVVVLGYLIGNLLGPWGGIGVTEAALASLGVHFGVPAEAAAAAALLHRAVFYVIVLTCGGVSLWVEGT